MIKLIKVIKKDLKLILRHRWAIIAHLCLPFLLYGLFAFIFSGMMNREADITPLNVAVVDKENSVLSRILINNFKGNKTFSKMVNIKTMNEKDAEESFNENELIGIITIPEDFSKSLVYIENYPINVVLNKREPLKSSVLQNMMESYGNYVSSVEKSIVAYIDYLKDYDFTQNQLENINEEMSVNLVLAALSRGEFFQEREIESIPSSSSAEYFIAATLVLLLMYNGVSAGNHLIKEINSGCLKRTVVSPVGTLRIVLGKWISFSLYSSVQVAIFILPAVVFFKAFHQDLILKIIVYMWIAIFFINGIFIFLATFFRKEELFMAVGNIFVFICALVGGSFLPLQLMPLEIQKLASITPNYWIIRGSLYIMNYSSGTGSIGDSSALNLILYSFIIISLLLILISNFRLRKAVRS
ncbi:MAG: ABC transporter permease [Clostridiales bacterium]|nr:ABC transporter permease [Clostridiales bacterium]